MKKDKRNNNNNGLALTHIQKRSCILTKTVKTGDNTFGPTQIIGGEAINNIQTNKNIDKKKFKQISGLCKKFWCYFFAILFDSLRFPLPFFCLSWSLFTKISEQHTHLLSKTIFDWAVRYHQRKPIFLSFTYQCERQPCKKITNKQMLNVNKMVHRR